MKKRFKSKNEYVKITKALLLVVIIYLVYKLFAFMVFGLNIKKINIVSFISNSIYYKESKKNSILNNIVSSISQINLEKPTTILATSLSYKADYNEFDSMDLAVQFVNESKNDNKLKVYIYNSHQGEEYSKKGLEITGIRPNVLSASYLLQDNLEKININSLVEDSNLLSFMKENNLKHKDSYKASRIFMLDAIKKNKSIELIIDIHRDSINKKEGTVKINNKDYAKVLFVVGLDNKNYKKNLQLTNDLNNLVKKKYPSLTRGVLKKQGSGVDGIYNQDVSEKVILLEIGGYQNTMEEVENTVEIISEIIGEYLS